jgi:hypothetical protein
VFRPVGGLPQERSRYAPGRAIPSRSDYVGEVDDDAICALLTRLARPDASGGDVIERAAILAEGPNFAAIMAWIMAHGGKADAATPTAPKGGLHGSRLMDGGESTPRTPLRFVLPPGALARGNAAARTP